MKVPVTDKAVVLAGLLIALPTTAVFAAGPSGHDHSRHHGAAPAAKGKQQRHVGTGRVKSIDRKAGEIELSHGPIPSLDMPGMTMGFPVKDRALLDKAKPGQDVEFVLVEREHHEHVITEIKPK